MIKEAEREWVEKNKPYLWDKDETPKKVFYTYCERMGLSEDQVIEQMDWDFFSEDKADEE
jgi:hypothetical protein